MYKISGEAINFIEKTMNTWIMILTAGGKSLAEAKIQRGILQGDAQSLLIFIVAMIPLNHIRRKCTDRYKLSKSQEKIYHLMYTDDIKQQKRKRTGHSSAHHENIEMEFGIEKHAMLIMKSGKRHLTD